LWDIEEGTGKGLAIKDTLYKEGAPEGMSLFCRKTLLFVYTIDSTTA